MNIRDLLERTNHTTDRLVRTLEQTPDQLNQLRELVAVMAVLVLVAAGVIMIQALYQAIRNR